MGKYLALDVIEIASLRRPDAPTSARTPYRALIHPPTSLQLVRAESGCNR
jgi:hypothetical protein